MGRERKHHPTLADRKPYVEPALAVHGDLRRLTAGAGGSNNEAGPGSAKSKVGGQPG